MTDPQTMAGLALALGLGLLVGLQRQWATDPIAGIRTFPLISLTGALAAELSGAFGVWLVPTGLAAIAAFLVAANTAEREEDHPTPGITTEVAALALYLIGAGVMVGYRVPAAFLAGVITVLLHWKTQLHTWVSGLDAAEIRAVVRLVLLALVILPLLPNQAYGPYAVLNPFRIWLMVVLIVGISLAAYVAYEVFGSRTGTVMAGLLGGLISSTATSVAYASESKAGRVGAGAGSMVIMIASAVVFARVLVEVTAVHASFLPVAAPPLLIMMAVMAALTWVSTRQQGTVAVHAQEASPPSGIRTAVVFGLMYGAILIAVAFAEDRLGSRGLYAVATLSGLADVDAITLSISEMVREGRLDGAQGWRLILVGAMSNILFKGIAVAALGSRALARRVGVLFALTLASGIVLMLVYRS